MMFCDRFGCVVVRWKLYPVLLLAMCFEPLHHTHPPPSLDTLISTSTVPPTTRRRLVRRSICWHTFLTWVPKVIRRSYVTPRNVGEGVQLGGTPLMVIWGRHCASPLSRLKKATSHFAALRVRRACWLQLTNLSTSACILTAAAG